MMKLFAAAVVALAAGGAFAHDYSAGSLTISHPHAYATPPSARTAAGYMTIENGGGEPDRLLAIRADGAEAEVHATERDAEGVARMRPVEALEIPAGAAVALEPQGLHVMFMGLEEPLEAGERLPATLVFERAGEVAVEFAVEPRAAAASEHEGHGGGD